MIHLPVYGSGSLWIMSMFVPTCDIVRMDWYQKSARHNEKGQLWFFINFHKHNHVKIKGGPVGIKCQEIERGAIPDLIIS